jgi:stearoyl-CoA 9-desaturase NADPH oxidoreductase
MTTPLRTAVRWARSPGQKCGFNLEFVGEHDPRPGRASDDTTAPDDYLSLLNPLWSARELRGEIVAVEPETDDTATVIIRPGWGFSGDYQPFRTEVF